MIKEFGMAIAIAGIAGAQAVWAEPGRDVSTANAVDVTGSEVFMFSQQMSDTSLTCQVNQHGKLDITGPLHLGDTISRDGKSFKIGIIEKSVFTQDVSYNGVIAIHKGDVVCMLGEDAAALPYEGDCNAVWVRVTPCKVME